MSDSNEKTPLRWLGTTLSHLFTVVLLYNLSASSEFWESLRIGVLVVESAFAALAGFCCVGRAVLYLVDAAPEKQPG